MLRQCHLIPPTFYLLLGSTFVAPTSSAPTTQNDELLICEPNPHLVLSNAQIQILIILRLLVIAVELQTQA